MAMVAAVGRVGGNGPAVCARNRSQGAAFEKPPLFGWKTRRKGVGIGVSGHLPVRVTARRNADTRQGTASGNYRSGDIAAGPRRDPPPRRQLDRPVPSARSTPPRGLISSAVAQRRPASPGSRATRHDWTGLASRGARARSIGPCESRAEDVLEEAPEELNARQPLNAPRVGAAIFPAEGHMGLVHAENPCVADGRAKDIPRPIGQHGVVPVAVVLAEGDPLPPPDVSRDGRENGRRRGLQGRAKLAAILRERASTGTRNSRRAGSQCWPSGVIPPPVISRWTWG